MGRVRSRYPSGMKFLDPGRLASLTGRCDYKRPDEPDVLPPPDALVVAPATFNTINKLAAGISDTLALCLLNEAVGTGLPIIAVPFPKPDARPSSRLPRRRGDPACMRRAPDLRPWASPAASAGPGRVR
jgi:Flavoprotein